MKLKNIFFSFVILLGMLACNPDEEGIEVVPPRPLAEIQLEDDEKIQQFLATNFYNYEEFENPPVGFDFKIKIDSVIGDNANKRPLSEFVRDTTIEITSAGNLPDSDVKVGHKLYYLIAREGGGERVTPYDSIYHKYEGTLLNLNSFETVDNFIWRDIASSIRGFLAGISKLKTGSGITVNNDGTTNIEDTGIGMVIMPSALGYYNGIRTGIPAYSPLIFKLEVGLDVKDTDADNDGIPSRLEDLNTNGFVADDNTNLQEEIDDFNGVNQTVFPNFVDPDDDGDGIPTRDEIIINEDGTLEFPDTDGDGIPDYLDRDTN